MAHGCEEKTENQRALLPEVRPETGHVPVERRTDLLHPVHGEVHVGVEPGQLDVHPPVTAGAAVRRMSRGGFSFLASCSGGSDRFDEFRQEARGFGLGPAAPFFFLFFFLCTTHGFGKQECGGAERRVLHAVWRLTGVGVYGLRRRSSCLAHYRRECRDE